MSTREKRPRGRPKGPPSEVVNIRMPLDLLERLDRFLDTERVWSDAVAKNRAEFARTVVDAFLAEKGY